MTMDLSLNSLGLGGVRDSSDLNSAVCSGSITTPVDATLTIPVSQTYCSTGAIEIDSVAAGNGIVEINGAWRLT